MERFVSSPVPSPWVPAAKPARRVLSKSRQTVDSERNAAQYRHFLPVTVNKPLTALKWDNSLPDSHSRDGGTLPLDAPVRVSRGTIKFDWGFKTVWTALACRRGRKLRRRPAVVDNLAFSQLQTNIAAIRLNFGPVFV